MKRLPPNYMDVEQGSAAWFDLRLGCVTSSRVADALAFLSRASKNGQKGDEAQARKNLKAELVAEKLTHLTSEHYVSMWMEQGKENEPLARTAFEERTGLTVDLIGYVMHERIKMAGASPDGLIGDDGLLEIKCPKTSTHFQYLLSGDVPAEYQPQMLWQMACTGRQWCDFCSFDQRMPEKLQLFIIRFPRDEQRIAEMEKQVEQFLREVDEMYERLTQGLEPILKRSLDAVKPDLSMVP